MEKISKSGAVISEFPGIGPFPKISRRNRIISGLSAGTIVIEAGKEVALLLQLILPWNRAGKYCSAGGIKSPYSKGCHKLIKEGAKLVEKVEDILEELQSFPENEAVISQAKTFGEADDQGEFSVDEIKLIEVISYEPLILEDIVRMSKMPISTVNTVLLNLELKGIIKQLPGKYFVRN